MCADKNERPVPTTSGTPGIDICRLDSDGKFIEHCDALQVFPTTSTNGNGMF